MIFIKFLKHEATKMHNGFNKLTIIGKLLLILQIISMFIPLLNPNIEKTNVWILLYFISSIIIYIPISLFILVQYCLFITDIDDKPINDNEFLKLVTIPFAIIAMISIISLIVMKQIIIIQIVSITPFVFTIIIHIRLLFDKLPKIKIKLPKINIKKLFIKE